MTKKKQLDIQLVQVDHRNSVTIRLSHTAVHIASLEPLDTIIHRAEGIVKKVKLKPSLGSDYDG